MDIKKTLERLVQVGVVSDVDNVTHRCRCIFPSKISNGVRMSSGWLYVLNNRPFIPDYGGAQRTEFAAGGGGYAEYASHSHSLNIKQWMPKINDRVLVIYLPCADSDGFVIGGIP